MFRTLLACTILVFPAPGLAASVPGWLATLRPFLDRVAEANPGTAARNRQARAIHRAAGAEGALPDPVVGLGIQALPTDGDPEREPMTQLPTVSLRQGIPFPGGLAARAAAGRARGDAVAAEAEALAETRGLALAAAAFQRVQLTTELTAVEATLDWLRLLERSAQANYRAGRGLGLDVDQLRVELARLEAEASGLQAGIAAAESRWRRVLDRPWPEGLTLEDDAAWTPAATAPAAATAANPDVRVAGARAEAARSRLDAARSTYGPDLSVELVYGVRHQGRRDFMTGRIGASVPLWGPWSQRPRVDGAQHELAAAELEQADARLEAREQWSAVAAQLRDAARRERLYAEAILPQAAAARNSASDAYEAGSVDIFVPIEAIRRELTSRREFARVRAERRLSEARLQALAGRLTGAAEPQFQPPQQGSPTP